MKPWEAISITKDDTTYLFHFMPTRADHERSTTRKVLRKQMQTRLNKLWDEPEMIALRAGLVKEVTV